MSQFALKVKEWYDLGLWSEGRVREAVEKEKISAEEYRGITGREYNE